MSAQPEPQWLPEFPTDDDMLDRIEHALGTRVVHGPDIDWPGEPKVRIGGDYTLAELLEFYSGADPDLLIGDGGCQDYPWPQYSEHAVIRALVAEIRRLRSAR